MIRLKVKTVVIIVGLLAMSGGIFYALLPTLLYYNGHYDALLRWFPNDRLSAKSFIHLGQEGSHGGMLDADNRIFIFSRGHTSSGGQAATPLERAELIATLEAYLQQYGHLELAARVKVRLAKLYMWQSDWDKAERLFKEIDQSQASGGLSYSVDNYLPILESRYERPDQTPALAGIVQIDGKPAADVFVVLRNAQSNMWSSPPYGHYPVAITGADGAYRFYDIEPGEYGIGIGITRDAVQGYVVSEPEETTTTITNGQTATYDFRLVRQVVAYSPGDKETIDSDQIHFQWESYEGAAYYQITMYAIQRDRNGKVYGSDGAWLEERHIETEAIYPIHELRKRYTGASKFTGEGEAVVLSTTGILGPAYPGGEFVWSVSAYNEQGLKLSDSTGYFMHDRQGAKAPLFRLSEEGQLEGDKLVLQARYEEAIEAYERLGDNDQALRALARMAELGITKEAGDPAAALAYMERMKEPNSFDLDHMASLRERIKERK